MQDLIKQEQFEMEVLEKLNSCQLLSALVFGGGTMLRLCFGLNRFSVDLDFWLTKKLDKNKLFNKLKSCLSQDYAIKDSVNKFYTLLFEIKSKNYPRSLKIEIRKESKKIKTETAIAYSQHSNSQVFLRVVSPKEMMAAKIDAFIERKEIRDAFDMEFLLQKGIRLEAPDKKLKLILKRLTALKKSDYQVKLGSLLEEGQRLYYQRNNFKILKEAIKVNTP